MAFLSREQVITETTQRYPGVEIPGYKLRSRYSREHNVFFDCDEPSVKCLRELLEYNFHEKFVTFIVVSKDGKYKFMSISYRNASVEPLEHFMDRYEETIKPSLIMTLYGSDKEFVELLGYSYE